MHVPGYLQKALNDCNPEVRAQLTLAIAKSANRTLFWYRLWTNLESGATCLFVLFTLSVLLFSSINQQTTAWFQSLKLFSSTPHPSSFILRPSTASFNPEQGKKLEVGDKVAGYPITNGFGWRTHPVYGTHDNHNGVDVAMPSGTKIIAPFDGEVEQVTNDRCGYGLRYYSPQMPRHRVGMCHLSDRIAAGKVKSGQQIALSGGSPGEPGAGASTGSHLHFALFNANGDPVPSTTEVVQKFLDSPEAGGGSAAINYLLEIGLGSEFGGDEPVIRKWKHPVRIRVHGSPTHEDLRSLNQIMAELQFLTGLQISMVGSNSNLDLHFAASERFKQIEPSAIPGNLGFFATRDHDNEIRNAVVLISTTGVTQQERSHLIREELTQSLGLMKDSYKYSDSIFYQPWTAVSQYSEIDKAVIRMLYSPKIQPGMTAAQVRQVYAQ